MSWVLIIGFLWLSVGVFVGVLVGRSIRAADRIDDEFGRLQATALPVASAGQRGARHRTAPPAMRLVPPPEASVRKSGPSSGR
jgi:hypothetical protein